LNLEKSINNLSKRLDTSDLVFKASSKIGLRHWKGKSTIPLDGWTEIRNTSYTLDCFPDDFDQDFIYVPEGGLNGEPTREDIKEWDSNYLELMEYTRNPNYGKLKCFHCLLNPAGDDSIFIGINRLVAKGLTDDEQEDSPIEYPCQIVNRFQCPYERTNIKKGDDVGIADSQFDAEDLFKLERMTFIVEIALAKARKNDSEVQIKDKQDLLHALTDRDTFTKILKQAADTLRSTEYLKEISAGQDNNYIVDYFMSIKDKIDLDELRLY